MIWLIGKSGASYAVDQGSNPGNSISKKIMGCLKVRAVRICRVGNDNSDNMADDNWITYAMHLKNRQHVLGPRSCVEGQESNPINNSMS